MNKQVALQLNWAIKSAGRYLSDPNRPNNFDKSIFTHADTYTLSERSAAVIYEKHGGKLALIHFLWFGNEKGKGTWRWYALSESHVYGFQFLPDILNGIEQVNFPLNQEIEEVFSESADRFYNRRWGER